MVSGEGVGVPLSITHTHTQKKGLPKLTSILLDVLFPRPYKPLLSPVRLLLMPRFVGIDLMLTRDFNLVILLPKWVKPTPNLKRLWITGLSNCRLHRSSNSGFGLGVRLSLHDAW